MLMITMMIITMSIINTLAITVTIFASILLRTRLDISFKSISYDHTSFYIIDVSKCQGILFHKQGLVINKAFYSELV